MLGLYILYDVPKTMFLSALKGSETSERKVLAEKHDGKERGMRCMKGEVLGERWRAESTD